MARHSKGSKLQQQQSQQQPSQPQQQTKRQQQERSIQRPEEKLPVSFPRSLFPSFRAPSFFPGWFDDFGNAWNQLISEQQTGLSVYEDNKNVYVEANLPGLRPQDIELSLDNGILWIKGEKKEEDRNEEKKYYHRTSNSFSYRVTVPNQIDASKEPKATYKDGIMKVTFAKTNASQSKKIPVRQE